MKITSTHTNVLVEVSDSAFYEIHNILKKAGYEHCFQEDGSIDMHGLALQQTTEAKETTEPVIVTNHFHNRPMPLSSVLYALAAQEGNDGDEGNAMQMAAEFIRKKL
jgi:hypothetical protein